MPESSWSGDSDPPSPPPAPPPTRRKSIANRVLGSFNRGRKDKERDKDRDRNGGAQAQASVKRRPSTADKTSPLPRIKAWLDDCKTEHNGHCSGGDDSGVATWRPVYLIDTVERHLVKTQPADRYLALSYVWGTVNPHHGGLNSAMQLLKSNLETFQTKIPDDDLPETILDAIWLSKKLGLRYLWVDRLCIIQDDVEDMENHIRRMASVYANAYLTIVAAYGDASTGLLPINRRRSSREPRSNNRDHSELLKTSRWNTRGWTLQESLYSRRAVFFFQNTVTWQCHCAIWQKGSSGILPKIRGNDRPEACVDQPALAAFGFRHSPWPDLDEYARIAADYSSRRVTLVDDTLRAFSGITFMLSRVFTGGFMYGMPLMFLDIALLWRPSASIRRRALSRPPFLPSWSWLGWWFDGIPVDLTLWRAAADYIDDSHTEKVGQAAKRFRPLHSFRIRPTVTWNLTDRTSTVPVPNTGLSYRELRSRKNAGAPLPPGWSKDGSYFTHDSDDITIFKYPVPIMDPPKEGEDDPVMGEQAFPGPLLSFKTTSGFFEVDLCDTMGPKDRPNPPIAVGNIWSRSNKWIGEFRAHDGWLGIQTSNVDGDERLEFIAISTGMERKGSYIFTADKFEENMDQDGIVNFVNVLWIERIGGVAYRRGIGHILQKEWNTHEKDEVDILLG
ncbi:hypothetical protein PT974_08417 [Cladobotryum mycophilum]|uniref:Heterokaryon incompatibility domain-containing protein n=1 Tax=Cladobotryum mycophilum TaxID=491253 RepID=A0ABR0SE86_9HYPO